MLGRQVTGLFVVNVYGGRRKLGRYEPIDEHQGYPLRKAGQGSLVLV